MKNVKKLILLVFISLSFLLNACYYDNEEDLYLGNTACDTLNMSYTSNVAPIFAAQCNNCHSGGAPSGNISTDNYTNVKANISRIKGAINHTSGFSAMPQGGSKLGDCELLKINAWINQGMINK